MPNPHDRTGLIQYISVPITASSVSTSHATFRAIDQMHVERAYYTAQTAATGATAITVGVADGGSTVVSATSIAGSVGVSLTVSTQLIAKDVTIFVETDTAGTSAAVGGMVTFKVKWDERDQLQEGQ